MQGTIINGFVLKRLLGVGGMAEVWYAENEIHMAAAVKLLNIELSRSAAIVERFKQEAEIMVKLEHHNIRKIYGYGTIDGRPAIVMEYLEGADLGERLKKGERFSDEDLIKWWNQLVDALTYTHNKGIVHRDIKPGNIFIDKGGNVKLLDFGIAKIKESISKTRTGTLLGTLMYMSPEQVMDSKWVGPESDNYSLAVTFVHLITGKEPYDINELNDYTVRKQIVEIPLEMTGVSAEWRELFKHLLVKAPEKRGELKPFVIDPKAPKNSKKKPWLWIALAAIVIGVAGWFVIQNEAVFDPDTKAFKECQTIADYRNYMSYYGRGGKHYSEAKNVVDKHVADSTAKAEAEARAEAERPAQIEADQRELEAYNKCKTIKDCDNYLKEYPNGRYVNEVKAKKQELERIAKEGKRRIREKNAGVFSVSSRTKVKFAQGNLQYQASTKTWRFAEHQWDMIGDANKNISSSYSGWIDLFGWGTGNNPILATRNYGDYNSFNDWGNNTIMNGDNNKWRTLTIDEWEYLIKTRDTSSGIRYAEATVNGVKGVILLPDNWSSSNYSLSNPNNTHPSFNSNLISQTDWCSKFEPNGAVFLPAAGLRSGTYMMEVGSVGHYWSSIPTDDPSHACFFEIVQGEVFGNNFYRNLGMSVRLVSDVEN